LEIRPGDPRPAGSFRGRSKRWSRIGVFARITTELAARAPESKIVLIDATEAQA
jgi:hypothetical protein